MPLSDVRVADIMHPPTATIAPDRPLADALDALAASTESFIVVAAEGGAPAGILTDGDVLRLVLAERLPPVGDAAALSSSSLLRRLSHSERLRQALGHHVSAWMTAPVATVEPEDTLDRVIDLLVAHGCRQLPVVRDGRLAGFVRRSDLLGPIADAHREAARESGAPDGESPLA